MSTSNMPQQTYIERVKQDWITRFAIGYSENGVFYPDDDSKRQLAFLSSSLSNLITELAEKIGEMRKLPTEDQEYGLEEDEAYDSALEDCISLLNQYKK